MFSDPAVVVAKVVQALDRLGVVYMVGGSLASSTYGIGRTTLDADLVTNLRLEHVSQLAAELADEFYADADMMRDAIRRRGSFNVLHLPTGFKVDVFILQTGPWAREELARRRETRIDAGEEAPTLYLCSPEDVVLHKLEWYRAGGGVSDRQWSDVLGVLKVQGNNLDLEYLRHWAAELGLTELLERALHEAGLEETDG